MRKFEREEYHLLIDGEKIKLFLIISATIRKSFSGIYFFISLWDMGKIYQSFFPLSVLDREIFLNKTSQ